MPLRPAETTNTQFLGNPATPLPTPTWGETFDAAFNLENDVSNAIDLASRPTYTRDPQFDWIKKLKEGPYWNDYRDNFIGTRNEQEFNDRVAQIEQERKNQETLSRAGWSGTVAAVAAGAASPTMLLPLLGDARGLKAVFEAASWGLLGGTLQELPLQANQQTRTWEQSALSIGSSTVLSGILGGAVSMLKPAEFGKLATDLHDAHVNPGGISIHSQGAGSFSTPRAIGADIPTPQPAGRVAGSAVRTILKVTDSNAITRSPVTSTLNGESDAARFIMAQYGDAGLSLEGNARGIPTTPGGTIENATKLWNKGYEEAIKAIDTEYGNYFYNNSSPKLLANTLATVQGHYSTQYMSKVDFQKAVGEAMFGADKSENAFVEKVAQKVRESVWDPMLEEAQNIGLMAKELPKLSDPSHMYRMFLQDAIRANRKNDEGLGLADVLRNHFQEGLTAEFSQRLAKLETSQKNQAELLTDIQRPQAEIERLRKDFLDELKRTEENLPENVVQQEDQINVLRAQARSLIGTSNVFDPKKGIVFDASATRKQLLSDARDMEKKFADWQWYRDLKSRRAEIKRRLRNLNKAQIVLEEKHAKKLEKIDRAEELSINGLMRVARAGQRILNHLADWSDAELEKQLSNFKTQFAETARLYDKGEEKIAKLSQDEGLKTITQEPPTFTSIKDAGGAFDKSEINAQGKRQRVALAAVRYNGELFTAESHAEALVQFEKQHPEAIKEIDANPEKYLGFVSRSDSVAGNEAAIQAGLTEEVRQAARTERLNKLSASIADIEDTNNRAVVRDTANAVLHETMARVEEINARRAVRTERLRGQAEKMAPGAIDARIAAIKGEGSARAASFNEGIRKLGADSFDPVARTADFTNFAQDQADAAVEKILGTYIRLPTVDVMQDIRGSVIPRVLDIPSAKIMTWLETDIEKLLHAHIHTLGPDIEIARKFKGSVNMDEILAPMWDEMKAKVKAIDSATVVEKGLKKWVKKTLGIKLKDGAELTAAQKEQLTIKTRAQYALYKQNIADVHEKIRHNFGLPTDPNGAGYRLGKLVSNLNVLRYMGMVTVSSIPDLAQPIVKYGVSHVFREAFIPLVTNLKALRMSAREAKYAGVGNDVALNMRAQTILDVTNNLGRGSRFERGVSYLTSRQGLIAGFNYWTDLMKGITAVSSNAKIMDSIARSVNGGDAKAATFLAENGIGPQEAAVIWNEALKNGGTQKVNGMWLPNTESWTDKDAKRFYRSALAREVDRTIVTPGVERPSWTSRTQTGQLVSQFKSFAFSSTYRVLLAGLQQRDRHFVEGIIASIGLGYLSYYLSSVIAGGKAYENMLAADHNKWADEAIQRSGVLGVFGMGQDLLTRIPLTGPYSSFSGGRTTRQGGDDLLQTILGPTYGDFLSRSASVVTGLDDPTQNTAHQFRTLLPWQNLIIFRRLLDQIGDANPLDLPKRRGQ